MILEFSIENFRSFKDRTTLSFLPAAIRERRKVSPIDLSEYYRDLSALPTAVLYGANNSGKSNLLKAALGLRWLITKSAEFNSDKKLGPYEPFLMDLDCRELPVRFELDFITNFGVRYLFAVGFNADEILEESLVRYHNSPKGKITKQTLYRRDKQQIKFGPELTGIKSFHINPNQLVLSRGDVGGNAELQKVYAFFTKGHFEVIRLSENAYVDFLNQQYKNFATQDQNRRIKSLVDKIIQQADPSVVGIKVSGRNLDELKFPEDLPEQLKNSLLEHLSKEIFFEHRLYKDGKEDGSTAIPLSKQSTGTRKLLAILPEILPILDNGGVLFFDELNTSLHTEITTFIIGLFTNPKTNPHRAQLISTTHDIILLNRELYDRDQIYITEKNQKGISILSCFSDFDFANLRSSNLGQYYEDGRLGGLPNLFTPYLHSLIADFLSEKHEQKKSAAGQS